MGEDIDIHVELKWDCPHSASFGLDMYNPDGDKLLPDVGNDSAFDTPFYDFGSLNLYVPFPMQVSTGVSSVMSVRIWTYLTDFKYAAYYPKDNVI